MRTSYDASVTEWTDANTLDIVTDSYGSTWKYCMDAMDGTVAVSEVTDGEQQLPLGRCGIFVWDKGPGCQGRINVCEDGDVYSVNGIGDHVVRNGEWEIVD